MSPRVTVRNAGGLKTVLLVLVAMEALGIIGILQGWPILGDFYEGYGGLSLLVSAAIACVSLLVWHRISRSASGGGDLQARGMALIPPRFAWFVLVCNALATAFIGYGAVGYTGGLPFAFLLTVVPLEPLLIAYISQRRKFDWPLMSAYAALGLMRGWTGHLFLLLLAYLLLATRHHRRMALLLVIVGAVFVYEPVMQVRAVVRGFDDATGLLLYRIASRVAMTPISDYTLNSLPAIAACEGMTYISWAAELLYSVVPRSLLGVEDAMSIHGCLAIIASGDVDVGLTFSTTLAVKAALVWLNGPIGFAAFCVSVYLLLRIEVYLAKRVLGAGAYVYVALFVYAFFLSGVMRDLALPVYFLALVFVFGLFLRRRRVESPSHTAQPSRGPAATVIQQG